MNERVELSAQWRSSTTRTTGPGSESDSSSVSSASKTRDCAASLAGAAGAEARAGSRRAPTGAGEAGPRVPGRRRGRAGGARSGAVRREARPHRAPRSRRRARARPTRARAASARPRGATCRRPTHRQPGRATAGLRPRRAARPEARRALLLARRSERSSCEWPSGRANPAEVRVDVDGVEAGIHVCAPLDRLHSWSVELRRRAHIGHSERLRGSDPLPGQVGPLPLREGRALRQLHAPEADQERARKRLLDVPAAQDRRALSEVPAPPGGALPGIPPARPDGLAGSLDDRAAVVANADLGRLVRDRARELPARRRAAARRHGLRLAVEAGGDAPARPRSRPPARRSPTSGRSSARPARAGRTPRCSRRRCRSRAGGVLRLREAGDLDLHAVDARTPAATGRRAPGRPCRSSKPSTVTAMFGIVSWPALRSVTTSAELLASFWSSGNSADTTSTGKSPSGSFSSWRSPPPHPATARRHSAATLLRLKAARTYHRIRRTRAGCRPATVPSGGPRMHAIGFRAGRSS